MTSQKHPYDNPDTRCRYGPVDGISYCWSYAHHVDGDPKFADLESICKMCELFLTTTEEDDE